jgi:hypothetical protein
MFKKIGTALFCLYVGVWAWNKISDRFFPDSPEEIALEEKRKEERRAEAERKRVQREREREREKELENIKKQQDFENSLAANRKDIQVLNLAKFSKTFSTETELQNDATEEKIKGKYFKMTGEVLEVDSPGDSKFGYKKYLVQIWEPSLLAPLDLNPLVVTSICHAKSEESRGKMEKLKVGDKITLGGQVKRYGDMVGLQLGNCTIY